MKFPSCYFLLLVLSILYSCNNKNYRTLKDGIELNIENSKLIVQVCAPSIIHVSIIRNLTSYTFKSLVVDRTWPAVAWTSIEKNDTVILKTHQIQAFISLKTGNIKFTDSLQKTFLISKGPDSLTLQPAVVQDEQTFHGFQKFIITPDEGLFGLGQYQDGNMNYRQKEVLFAQANRTFTVPFLLSTNNYGLLWDNYSQGWFKCHGNEMSFSSEVTDGIDYYFMSGKNPDDVISSYRQTSGKAPMFGKWAYGYWQSKEHYKTQFELIDIAREFRNRNIPIDNIVQDWSYWGYDNNYFSGMIWDKKRYPSPEAMIDSLHKIYHFHLMCSIWPAVGTGTKIYEELNSKGYIFPKEHWSTGRLYDAYNTEARSIYWKYLNEGLFSKGVDAFWMDGSEPEITSTADPYITSSEIKLLGRNSLGTFSKYLNSYSLVHTRGVYENERNQNSKKRVFILTRSAFLGQQKYGAATWSGDIGSNWKVFKNQIPAGLNFCMAGIPYWTTDIGGFLLNSQGGMYPEGGTDPAFGELYVRWFEYAAFCPIFRSHGTGYPREPWQFGDNNSQNYKAILKYDQLRYRLLPYIYSCAWKITHDGYTLMRGLGLDFPRDSQSINTSDEFMFGPSFLVCPVTREMYNKTKKLEDFIPPENLYNDKNEIGNLNLVFYKGKTTQIKIAETPMVEIALSWSGQIPDEAKKNDYTAIWTGGILSERKGRYLFIIQANSPVKLWLNNKLLISSEDTTERKLVGEIMFDSVQKYSMRLENYQFRPGVGNLKLEWIAPKSSNIKKQKSISCYLPPAKFWYDFWTGEKHAGKNTIDKNCPLDVMPLFIRAGSIIPMGPFIEYTDEKPADPLELRIYSGESGNVNLYEDEGDTYNYENGIYSLIPITWDEANKILTIGKRKGVFPGMLRNRTFKIIWVDDKHGNGLELSSRVDELVKYNGEELRIKR